VRSSCSDFIVLGLDDNPSPPDAQWASLIAANEKLATSKSVDEVVAVLRDTARAIVRSDGIAIVLREDDKCYYVAEDAIAPLWASRRFPASTCVSGWAMMHRQTVTISDIFLDPRIPQDAYRPTFVRSLVMVPIGAPEARAAIGAYWAQVRTHDPRTVAMLEALGRSAAISLENVRLMTAIEESERQRETALSAGRMGTWSLDIETKELRTSSTCRLNFGRNLDRELSYEEFLSAIHADDVGRLRESLERSAATDSDCDGEYRIPTCDGVRWIVLRAKPAFVGNKSKVLSGVSMDITQRKLMEDQLRDMAANLERRVKERTEQLSQTQAALRQSQKLEAMGQLTGGVAHDFNNLLAPIMGSLDLLKRRGVGSEREQRLIEGALESSHRAKTLVHRLLAFARRQPLTPTAVDIASLLGEMSTLIATTLGPQIRLVLELAPDLPCAVADRNQIEMAVLNLAVNARDAMPNGGQVIVSAQVDEVGASHRSEVAPGRYIRIAVADTGCGMNEETRRRAIEPFFSTKGIGKGTGLGLSMVHGLASQLGGGLALASAPGRGTQVELWLPVSTEETAAERRHSSRALPSTPGVVLLVDDEDLVRASTADMLSEMGFQVIESSSGEEALDRLTRTPHIDLLVTDHLMPSMTGPQLARAVLAQRPHTAVLVISGYSEASDVPADLLHLEKPFLQGDLASIVARAFCAKSPTP
jgi:signal transduction histidine kinase/GAF domain-containing protein